MHLLDFHWAWLYNWPFSSGHWEMVSTGVLSEASNSIFSFSWSNLNFQLDSNFSNLSSLLSFMFSSAYPVFLNSPSTHIEKPLLLGTIVGQHWIYQNHIKWISLNLSPINTIPRWRNIYKYFIWCAINQLMFTSHMPTSIQHWAHAYSLMRQSFAPHNHTFPGRPHQMNCMDKKNIQWAPHKW